MMTQEEFMDVMAMKRQGMSIKEIAAETGYHPSTISGWLRNGGPPEKRPSRGPAVIDEYWAAEIATLQGSISAPPIPWITRAARRNGNTGASPPTTDAVRDL